MPGNKGYAGQQMIKASHFYGLYPTLPEAEQHAVMTKMEKLIIENDEYCDKGNYAHLSNIFSAIAFYETLQNFGKSKEEALQKASEALWDYAENKTAKTYRRFFGLPGMLKLLGRLLPGMFAKGSGYGWSYVWHTESATDRYLQFECTSCIYARLFAKYGVSELGPPFCHCDDINYGKIPGITFKRKHTLCQDGQSCDFLFVKE